MRINHDDKEEDNWLLKKCSFLCGRQSLKEFLLKIINHWPKNHVLLHEVLKLVLQNFYLHLKEESPSLKFTPKHSIFHLIQPQTITTMVIEK